MKLYIPGLREAISFTELTVHTVVIENQNFLYSVLSDFDSQLNRFEGKAVLSIKDTPVEMHKYLELITDFVRFDLNTKALISKVNSSVDSMAMDEAHFLQTQTLLSQVENYIYELFSNMQCNLSIESISMLQIIKAAGVSISDDFATLCDKIYCYMEAVSEFLGEKLFVFVNMRNFVPDKQMQLFLDTVIKHGFTVLFLESVDRQRLYGENRITIDEDLCEF